MAAHCCSLTASRSSQLRLRYAPRVQLLERVDAEPLHGFCQVLCAVANFSSEGHTHAMTVIEELARAGRQVEHEKPRRPPCASWCPPGHVWRRWAILYSMEPIHACWNHLGLLPPLVLTRSDECRRLTARKVMSDTLSSCSSPNCVASAPHSNLAVLEHLSSHRFRGPSELMAGELLYRPHGLTHDLGAA